LGIRRDQNQESIQDPASRFAKFIAVTDAFATEHLNKKSTAETLRLSGFVLQANFIVGRSRFAEKGKVDPMSRTVLS